MNIYEEIIRNFKEKLKTKIKIKGINKGDDRIYCECNLLRNYFLGMEIITNGIFCGDTLLRFLLR